MAPVTRALIFFPHVPKVLIRSILSTLRAHKVHGILKPGSTTSPGFLYFEEGKDRFVAVTRWLYHHPAIQLGKKEKAAIKSYNLTTESINRPNAKWVAEVEELEKEGWKGPKEPTEEEEEEEVMEEEIKTEEDTKPDQESSFSSFRRLKFDLQYEDDYDPETMTEMGKSRKEQRRENREAIRARAEEGIQAKAKVADAPLFLLMTQHDVEPVLRVGPAKPHKVAKPVGVVGTARTFQQKLNGARLWEFGRAAVEAEERFLGRLEGEEEDEDRADHYRHSNNRPRTSRPRRSNREFESDEDDDDDELALEQERIQGTRKMEEFQKQTERRTWRPIWKDPGLSEDSLEALDDLDVARNQYKRKRGNQKTKQRKGSPPRDEDPELDITEAIEMAESNDITIEEAIDMIEEKKKKKIGQKGNRRGRRGMLDDLD